MKPAQWTAIAIGAVILMGGAGALASYMTRESMQPPAKPVRAVQHTAQAAPQPPAQPPCNDGNIVGTVIGGVGGGVVGSQLGKGNGKTAATIGGALGGAYLGNQAIPTRNVTCGK